MIHINYFKENKKKTAGVLSVIVLAILAISFVITATTSSILATEKAALTEPLKAFTLITPSPENPVLQQNLVEIIKNENNAAAYYKGYAQTVPMETLFGSISTYSLFLNDKVGLDRLVSGCGLTLKEGKMPEIVSSTEKIEMYQLAMHEDLLKNKKLKIGDSIWLSDGYYTICGVLSGKSIVSIGTRSRFLDSYGLNGAAVAAFVFPEGAIDVMNRSLLKALAVTGENYSYYEFEEQEKSIENSFETANFFLMFIYIVVVLIISLTLCLFIVNVYNARMNEFAILCAIGYTKKNVCGMIFRELLLLSAIGWTLGYGLSFVMLFILKQTLFAPKGLAMPMFSSLALIVSLLLPIAVLCFAALSVFRKLKRQDLISLIR